MVKGHGEAEFCKNFDVSRETMQKLQTYAELVNKWSGTINLVSKTSLHDIWIRHFLDSAQIFPLAKVSSGHWVDLGSGGGFPGIVVAIIASEKATGFRFTFVESDQRKAVFLQTVARILVLPITVVASRIEKIAPLSADILSARALAPLETLIGYTDWHLKPAGQALLMKGETFRREVDRALEIWSFQSDEYPSITDGAAVILSLGDIKRV